MAGKRSRPHAGVVAATAWGMRRCGPFALHRWEAMGRVHTSYGLQLRVPFTAEGTVVQFQLIRSRPLNQPGGAGAKPP